MSDKVKHAHSLREFRLGLRINKVASKGLTMAQPGLVLRTENERRFLRAAAETRGSADGIKTHMHTHFF